MEQSTALEILKSGVNVFLTGQAGAGKTYVLNQYIAWLRKRQIEPAITASTGIAATHIGGVTLHSWSGIGVRKVVDDDFLKKLPSRRYLRQRMRKVRVLIVDEVSMLDPMLLHCVDRVLQSFKTGKNLCRIIVSGPGNPSKGIHSALWWCAEKSLQTRPKKEKLHG